MDQRLERILPRVQKPARYVGGEYNAVVKEKGSVDTRVAFCFPDTYEIGMSNLGMRILYQIMNDMEGVWCERVFAPWGDMEAELRENHIPLYGLESGDSVGDFDIVAFSLGYEMAYPAVLNMLDLSGIPLRAEDRGDGLKPLVIAGGTAMYNAEPLADFIDLACIGEGEEELPVAPAGGHGEKALGEEVDHILRPPPGLGQVDKAGDAVEQPGHNGHGPGLSQQLHVVEGEVHREGEHGCGDVPQPAGEAQEGQIAEAGPHQGRRPAHP